MGLSAIGFGYGIGIPGGGGLQRPGQQPGSGRQPYHQHADRFRGLSDPGHLRHGGGLHAAFHGLQLPARVALAGAALLGAGISVGFAAIGSGLGSGIPAGTSTAGMARQPAASGTIRTNMLVGRGRDPDSGHLRPGYRVFAPVPGFQHQAGFAHLGRRFWAPASPPALSAIGPGLGNGLTAGEAAAPEWARMPDAQGQVTTSMLLGLTVAQSTVIYGFLVSLILLFVDTADGASSIAWAAMLSAGLCMGFGGIGPGIGEGITAAYAVKRVARGPENQVLITRVMLVGQAVSESHRHLLFDHRFGTTFCYLRYIRFNHKEDGQNGSRDHRRGSCACVSAFGRGSGHGLGRHRARR